MFEVGWSEMLVIAIVMIVIVGPKDLPNMLRTFGRTVAKLRTMAGDFQKQFNDALKEAELDDVKKSVDALRGLNPVSEIKKQLNPFEKAAADVRSGIDDVMKPKPAVAEPTAEPTFPAMTDSSVVAEPVAQPVKTPAPKKTAKAAAPKAAKPAPVKATSVKAAPAKAAPAKSTPAKAAPAKVAAKPAPAAEKPAATKKKTAGTAK